MDILNKLNDYFKKALSEKQINVKMILLFLGFAGILLIFLSELIPAEKNYDKQSENAVFNDYSSEEKLESRLEKIISKIKGAGKTSVMLTLESSDKFFYADNYSEENEEYQNGKESEIVIIEGANGEEPIIVKSEFAKIRGVLVICEGGDNALIKEKIIESVCALLDITSNKVSVAKMA